MRVSALVLGLFSVAVCVVSTAVHIASFIPGSGLAVHEVQWLHLGAMGAFFAMAIHITALHRRARRRVGNKEAVEKWTSRFVPGWARTAGMVGGLYVVINFLVFVATIPGQPRTYDGEFALYNHGKIVRRVSEEEFRDWERYEVRGVSAHWIMFSVIPAGYFLVVYPRARATLAVLPDPGEGPAGGVM